MPRAQHTPALKGRVVQEVPNKRKETNADAEAIDHIAEEWLQRGSQEDVAKDIESLRAANLPIVPSCSDQGLWLETSYRWLLRSKPLLLDEALADRCFRDTGPKLDTADALLLLLRLHQNQGQALDAERRRMSVVKEIKGGQSHLECVNMVLRYGHYTTNIRPHGFASLGRVEAGGPLDRVLLHGLQLFLATAFSPTFSAQLDLRLQRPANAGETDQHLNHYAMLYQPELLPDADVTTTFTGRWPLLIAHVPVFEHLSLARQLHYMWTVVTQLMPEAAGGVGGCGSQPADTVFNFAAFNKLLLLGLLAPVEEALAPDGTSELVHKQLQAAAAARQAEVASAAESMRQALSSFRVALAAELSTCDAAGRARLQLQVAEAPGKLSPQACTQAQQQLRSPGEPARIWAPPGSNGSSSSSSTQLGEQLDQLHRFLAAARVVPLCAQQAVGGGATSAGGMRGLLDAVLQGLAAAPAPAGPVGASAGQQQQQQQGGHHAPGTQHQVAEWVRHALMPCMQQQPGGGGSSSSSQPAAAGSGLVLLATLRQVSQLLLASVLSQAPPCEQWSCGTCQLVLQMLVQAERVTGAAHMQEGLEPAAEHGEGPPPPPQPRRAGLLGSLQQRPTASLHAGRNQGAGPTPAAAVASELLRLLHAVRSAQAGLAAGQDAASTSSRRRHSSTVGPSSQPSSSSSSSSAPPQHNEPQPPSMWREQLLSMYKSRPTSWAWFNRHFELSSTHNPSSGLWGALRALLAPDTLNMRHREAPECIAAAPPSTVIDPLRHGLNDDVMSGLAARALQLARLSNWACVAQWDGNGVPVQADTLTELLQLACIAAQQPSQLAYAEAHAHDLRAAAQEQFFTPNPSPEPGCSSSQHDAAGGSSPRGQSAPAWDPSKAAEEAAAAQAAWPRDVPLHLQALAQLGPLFEAGQARPCLARLMQLLLQHQQDAADGAVKVLASLSQKLRLHGVAAPAASGGSSSSSAGASSSSRGAAGAPPDSPCASRLMVLLLGLYHMHQLQQQQQQQHGEQLPACPYSSMPQRLQAIRAAVTAAFELRHLLLYSLGAHPDAGAAAAQQPRLRVCAVASTMAADGAALLRQAKQLPGKLAWQLAASAGARAPGAWPPPGAVCDFCSPKRAKATGEASKPRASATRACTGCHGFAWFCSACAAKPDALLAHRLDCPSASVPHGSSAPPDSSSNDSRREAGPSEPAAVLARAQQQLLRDAASAGAAGTGQPSGSSSGGGGGLVTAGWPCCCDVCLAHDSSMLSRLQLAPSCSPLGQYHAMTMAAGGGLRQQRPPYQPLAAPDGSTRHRHALLELRMRALMRQHEMDSAIKRMEKAASAGGDLKAAARAAAKELRSDGFGSDGRGGDSDDEPESSAARQRRPQPAARGAYGTYGTFGSSSSAAARPSPSWLQQPWFGWGGMGEPPAGSDGPRSDQTDDLSALREEFMMDEFGGDEDPSLGDVISSDEDLGDLSVLDHVK